jgi:hypothetical protein
MKKDFLPFDQAKIFIRKQTDTLSKDRYQCWVRENEFDFLPTNANRVYKTEWEGWPNYLGSTRKTYKLSEEDKDAMAVARKDVKKSSDHLEKMAVSQQNRRPGTRSKISNKLKNVPKSDEHKAKIKEKRAFQIITKESNAKRSISVSISKTGVKRAPFSEPWLEKLNQNLSKAKGSRISKVSGYWLDSMGIPDDQDHREVQILLDDGGPPTWVDGYEPTLRTVYEFNGDYWHGNPNKFPPEQFNTNAKKTMGELFKATQIRSKRLQNAGYEVIEIWESDWKARPSRPAPQPEADARAASSKNK